MMKQKHVWGWALYDWANSVYATLVIAGFFPVVFKHFWSQNLSTEESTFWLGTANGIASLLIVIAAPVLGAIGDISSIRKHMLFAFMMLGALATAGLYSVAPGSWQLALTFYVLGTIGFMAANVFYDSLLVNVSDEKDVDKISGLGYALGYLGGGLLLAVGVYMSQNFARLGFASAIDALLFSFLLAAGWWFLFTLPLMAWVKESQVSTRNRSQAFVRQVFTDTWRSFRHVISHRQIGLFLLAYWVYIDGIDTIIRMAVDYGLSLGFGMNDLIAALLITQFVGFPAAILYAGLARRIGIKQALIGGLLVYLGITLLGYQMDSAREFYILAVFIGMVQGGVQALSRSLYSRMIPVERSAEFFGIYNMMGKAAAVIGPILMGLTAIIFNDHRLSLLSVSILFIIGIVLLYRIDISHIRDE